MAETCWVMTDTRSKIIDASESWHALWGFEKSESVGQSISILNGADSAAWSTLMSELDRDGSTCRRCTNAAKDGTVYSHDLR